MCASSAAFRSRSFRSISTSGLAIRSILFGGEISSNSADFFAAGLKGRYKEQELYDDHLAADQTFTMTVVEDGQLGSREVALSNALNEVLRGEYVKDCEKGLARWNKTLAEAGHQRTNLFAKYTFSSARGRIRRSLFRRRR